MTAPTAPLNSLALTPFIYLCQRLRMDAGRYDTKAQQGCYMLWHCIDGVVHLCGPDAQLRLAPGDVTLVLPGFIAETEHQAWAVRLAFDLQKRPRRLNRHGFPTARHWHPQPSWLDLFGQHLPHRPPEALTKRIKSLLARIQVELYLHDWGRLRCEAMLLDWLTSYLADVLGQNQQRQLTEADTVVGRLEQLMRDRLEEGCTVTSLATILGYSTRQLQRIYTEARGISPGAYLSTLRIERAKELLQEDASPIKEVAHHVGMSEVGLRRAFKQQLGISPSQWRRGNTS